MIMMISMRNAFLVPIIFTILPSLHPPSFHEMIFILVYVVFAHFLSSALRLLAQESEGLHKLMSAFDYAPGCSIDSKAALRIVTDRS